MKDEFANRAGMHRTVLETLDQPAYRTIWEDQKPKAFSRKALELPGMITRLEEFAASQTRAITGHAGRKADEEADVIDLCLTIGKALAAYFEETGRLDLATEVEKSPTALERMRDEALLAHAVTLKQRLDEALTADAATLEDDYDLTPADATTLGTETQEYRDVIASPQTAIAQRKALTRVLRPEFAKVSAHLASMDRLIPTFRKTDPGSRFADAWTTARVVRDFGRGPSAKEGGPEA